MLSAARCGVLRGVSRGDESVWMRFEIAASMGVEMAFLSGAGCLMRRP